jgi:cytochrome P450
MADGDSVRGRAHDEAWSTPLEQLNPAQPALFEADAMWPVFERLRKEAPVHYAAESEHGPYWSITRYADIMSVDIDHEAFSSADGVALPDGTAGGELLQSFIAMDPPRHDQQRKVVSPAVAPINLRRLAPLIRERAGEILDDLPIGEEFDWVDKVSRELTAMTLATLFDVPQGDRRKLTYWSDVVFASPGHGLVESLEHKWEILGEFQAYFVDLWNRRVNAEPGGDLISMLAHSPVTREMTANEYFGNVILLTTGGNDTTRNTISGSLLASNLFPDEFRKLRENPDLLPSMVSEAIRWQTPVSLMRRRATRDVEIGGKTIAKGDKVAMWYISGNRDEALFEDPHRLIIERPRPRSHTAFGFGIHRCVGNRLAELQLTIIWEEMLKRFPEIIVTGEPKRTYSIQIRGYEQMSAIIPRAAAKGRSA